MQLARMRTLGCSAVILTVALTARLTLATPAEQWVAGQRDGNLVVYVHVVGDVDDTGHFTPSYREDNWYQKDEPMAQAAAAMAGCTCVRQAVWTPALADKFTKGATATFPGTIGTLIAITPKAQAQPPADDPLQAANAVIAQTTADIDQQNAAAARDTSKLSTDALAALAQQAALNRQTAAQADQAIGSALAKTAVTGTQVADAAAQMKGGAPAENPSGTWELEWEGRSYNQTAPVGTVTDVRTGSQYATNGHFEGWLPWQSMSARFSTQQEAEAAKQQLTTNARATLPGSGVPAGDTNLRNVRVIAVGKGSGGHGGGIDPNAALAAAAAIDAASSPPIMQADPAGTQARDNSLDKLKSAIDSQPPLATDNGTPQTTSPPQDDATAQRGFPPTDVGSTPSAASNATADLNATASGQASTPSNAASDAGPSQPAVNNNAVADAAPTGSPLDDPAAKARHDEIISDPLLKPADPNSIQDGGFGSGPFNKDFNTTPASPSDSMSLLPPQTAKPDSGLSMEGHVGAGGDALSVDKSTDGSTNLNLGDHASFSSEQKTGSTTLSGEYNFAPSVDVPLPGGGKAEGGVVAAVTADVTGNKYGPDPDYQPYSYKNLI